MKTRTEMIYDFMLALASNPKLDSDLISDIADDVYRVAVELADKYLENV